MILAASNFEDIITPLLSKKARHFKIPYQLATFATPLLKVFLHTTNVNLSKVFL
jgi:hypothetical protein